jgi:hypothetical protein
VKNIVLAIVAILVLGVGSIGLMYVNYSNREVSLRNLATAQEDSNKAIFDAVWKTISQKAQITDKYKEGFKEVYTGIMAGRYAGKNQVIMNWIKEANPNFDSGLYKSLMDTVEGQRERFVQVQLKLRDIKREHDNLRTTFPGSFFVGGRSELKVTIVTSDKTDNVFKSAQENNVSVF